MPKLRGSDLDILIWWYLMGSRNLYSYPVTQLIFYKGLNISVSVGIIETLFIKEGQKMKKNWRAFWWKWKESEKVGLKLNMQKTKIMASGPITSWEIDGETVETVADFTFWAPKSLQMVTVAMKLKDTYFLEGKLWPT